MHPAQTIALVGNGLFVPAYDLIKTYHAVIALDGGYNHCEQLGIAPAVVLGDGDSAPADAPLLHLADQNNTDLQKGLAWVAEHYAVPYQVDLFSVTSAERLDHTLSAIQLASHFPEIRYLYTPYQRMQIVRDQVQFDLPANTPLSILPIGTVATVAITGCQWSGNDIVLNAQTSGISNVASGTPIVITVKTGTVLVVNEHLWTKP